VTLKRWALAWLVVAVTAASAAAQYPTLDGRIDARLRAGIQPQLDSAKAAGLPTTPLVDKALEGVAKGADSARIVTAVRRLRGDLSAAHGALGSATPQELVAGAEAVRAGVNTATLARVRAARSSPNAVIPLAVLTDLVTRGVPPDTAASAVLTLTQARASDDDLEALRRNVERDIVAGVAPAVSAAVRARIPETGGQVAHPPSTVPP
jgi:hypothetical protein